MPNTQMRSIKDKDRYEAMRREGMSKEKAARIANTDATLAGKRGGRAPGYEDLTKVELYQKARRVGIRGRWGMTKKQLISALRYH